ncbi:MAG: CoA-transferase subunit beta [Actinomycetota bacterium]
MTVVPTAEDVMVVAGSRMLTDDTVVFAGVGAPLLASALAQRLHAPNLTIVLEGGYVGPRILPGKPPVSTNEMRAARGSVMLTGIVDVFLYAQGGHFDIGFVGAAQIDRFGNVNTSIIGPVDRPKVRLPGSGGANDIVSSCREILIITKHERRRFVDRVDFITSPGYLGGGDDRAQAGLSRSRPTAVISDLAVLGFDPGSKRMRLEALQPGVTVDEVVANTGFELLIASSVRELAPASPEELTELARIRGDDGAELPERATAR